MQNTRRSATLRSLRDRERFLASTIKESSDLPVRYCIMGNGAVIATTDMYDNATLIAEALASHSPYYSTIDIMSGGSLVEHYLSEDFSNDRRNHLAHL